MNRYSTPTKEPRGSKNYTLPENREVASASLAKQKISSGTKIIFVLILVPAVVNILDFIYNITKNCYEYSFIDNTINVWKTFLPVVSLCIGYLFGVKSEKK